MSLARLMSLSAAVLFCLATTLAQAVTLPVDDDLVLWLKADAGVTLASGKVSQWDDQLVGDNTTSNNAVQSSGTYQPIVVENASPSGDLPVLRFDANPYLDIADHADLNPGTGGYTIFLAGQRIDTSGTSRGWLSKQASPSASPGYTIWSTIEGSRTVVGMSDVGGDRGSQRITRPDDFSLVTMSLTGSQIFGFLDGSDADWADGGSGSEVNNDYTGSITNTRALQIGRGYNGIYPLSGDVAEILMYKADLSSSDRATVEGYLHAKWYDMPQPTLLMLPMNEGAGPTAYDSTGGNDATVDGATWTGGKLGQALHFDGNDRAVVGGDESDFDFASSSDGFSVEAWVKADNIGGSMSMVSKAAQASSMGGWDFWCDPNGRVGFRLFDGAMPSPTAKGTTSMEEDEWYHVVGTWNGSNTDSDAIKVYVNGILDGESTAMNAWIDNDFAVTIGKLASGSANWFFQGTIDEVAIFDRELSAPEVWHRFSRVPEPGTVSLLALGGLCMIIFGRRKRMRVS